MVKTTSVKVRRFVTDSCSSRLRFSISYICWQPELAQAYRLISVRQFLTSMIFSPPHSA